MISTAVQQSANVSASGRGAPARDILGGTFPATAQRENQPAEIPQERRNARQPDHRVDQHASHGRYAACLLAWARVSVTSNIVARSCCYFRLLFPPPFCGTRGEEEVPRILAFRRAQQARKRCMRCDAAGRLPRASSGPGQYGRQRRRSSMGRDCSLPSLAFRSQVCSPPPCPGRPIRMPAGASWAVRRLLRLAARG